MFRVFKNILPALNVVLLGQLTWENYEVLKIHVISDVISSNVGGLTLAEFTGLAAFCERKIWAVNIDLGNRMEK